MLYQCTFLKLDPVNGKISINIELGNASSNSI